MERYFTSEYVYVAETEGYPEERHIIGYFKSEHAVEAFRHRYPRTWRGDKYTIYSVPVIDCETVIPEKYRNQEMGGSR